MKNDDFPVPPRIPGSQCSGDRSDLSFHGSDGRLVAEPGDFHLWISQSSVRLGMGSGSHGDFTKNLGCEKNCGWLRNPPVENTDLS
jgi:hypothetical protein